MMRRRIIQFMALLLVTLPLLGVFAQDTYAASSRVAVIKEMKGTVKVKKAGGSKEFTAFAKMSLNEGDIVAVGASSSAILQFANGTSEDDKMTVSSNTTLTFSKLSNKKGTTTKVSMFNGSAWVDVKSIANKEDEFTLETPTAIMGVRGTHLLVSVDPVSGATRLTVAAGIVTTQSTAPGDEPQNVLPTQNALITKDDEGESDITIAQVDLELLMQQSDISIVSAIVQASHDIQAENIAKSNQYEDIDQNASNEVFKNNVGNIVGAIITQALESNVINQQRLNELVAQVKATTGVDVDISKKTLTVTDEEKALQEKQKQQDKEALEQAQKQKEDEQSRRDKELQDKLEAARKNKEEDNRKALEEQNKKAKEEYERQLSDLEKDRFNKDKADRDKESQSNAIPTPTSTPPSTPPSTSPSTPPSTPTPTPLPDHVSSFITGWSAKDSNNQFVNWTDLGSFVYQAKVDENVNSLNMQLAFDDTKYSIRAVDLSALFYGGFYAGLNAVNSPMLNMKSVPIAPMSIQSLLSASMSAPSLLSASSEYSFDNLTLATWNKSGELKNIPVDNAAQYYALIVVEKEDFELVEASALFVGKGISALNLSLVVDYNYINIAQTSQNTYVAQVPLDYNTLVLNESFLPDYAWYLSGFVPPGLEIEVTADNGATIESSYQTEQYIHLNTSATDPVTTVNIKVSASGVEKEKYTLSIFRGDPTSGLVASDITVTTTSSPTENIVTYAPDYKEFYNEIDLDSTISAINITTHLSDPTNRVEIYHLGKLLTNLSNITLSEPVLNEFDVVVRPATGDKNWDVYKIYLYSNPIVPELIGVKLDTNPVSFDESDFFETTVPYDTDLMKLTLNPGPSIGRWIVYDYNGETYDVDGTDLNVRDLKLKPGTDNVFYIGHTYSDYFYLTPYEIHIIRSPAPTDASLVNLDALPGPSDESDMSYIFYSQDTLLYNVYINNTYDYDSIFVKPEAKMGQSFTVEVYGPSDDVATPDMVTYGEWPYYDSYRAILLPGDTKIKIKVTAPDGTTVKTYEILVKKLVDVDPLTEWKFDGDLAFNWQVTDSGSYYASNSVTSATYSLSKTLPSDSRYVITGVVHTSESASQATWTDDGNGTYTFGNLQPGYNHLTLTSTDLITGFVEVYELYAIVGVDAENLDLRPNLFARYLSESEEYDTLDEPYRSGSTNYYIGIPGTVVAADLYIRDPELGHQYYLYDEMNNPVDTIQAGYFYRLEVEDVAGRKLGTPYIIEVYDANAR